MRILVISNLYPPQVIGGYEVGCANMVEELRSRGHDVTVLTSSTPASYPTECRPYVLRNLCLADIYSDLPLGSILGQAELYRGNVINLENLRQILEVLVSSEFDVIYCFNLLGLGAMGICDLLDELEVPWVWHLMDSIPEQMMRSVTPELGAPFRCFATREVKGAHPILISHNLAREIANAGISLKPAAVIPGWVKSSTVIEGQSKGEAVRFIFASMVAQHKGADLTLAALASLPPSARSKMHIEFFGGGDIRRYQTEAASLGLEEHVTFHGLVEHDRLLELLPDFDALLFPTWEREPFGFVALEAAASGVVPIMTKGIGATEVLGDGKHAVFIRQKRGSLAAAMLEVLADPERFRSMGEVARLHVEAGYTLRQAAVDVERELGRVARAISVSRVVATRAMLINEQKYRFTRSLVSAPLAGSLGVTDAYESLKAKGRSKSRWSPKYIVRSGLIKLLKPYLLELLERERQLQQRLNALERRVRH